MPQTYSLVQWIEANTNSAVVELPLFKLSAEWSSFHKMLGDYSFTQAQCSILVFFNLSGDTVLIFEITVTPRFTWPLGERQIWTIFPRLIENPGKNYKPSVVLLTETWLTKEHLDNEIFPNDTYRCFRLDRSAKTHPPDPLNSKKFREKGGGVLIAVRSDITVEPKKIPI